MENCSTSIMSHLDLQNNQLSNISSDIFLCLNALTYLNLAGNLLSKEVLTIAGLNYLNKLSYLNLNNSNVPILQKAMVGNMSGLTEFSPLQAMWDRNDRK